MIDKDLWDADELEIFNLFGFRCPCCGRDAVTLHEIDFKSHTKDWKRKGNRIPLCEVCHNLAHGRAAKAFKDKLIRIMETKLQ